MSSYVTSAVFWGKCLRQWNMNWGVGLLLCSYGEAITHGGDEACWWTVALLLEMSPHLCFHWFPLGYSAVSLCSLLLVPYKGWGLKRMCPPGEGSLNSLETIFFLPKSSHVAGGLLLQPASWSMLGWDGGGGRVGWGSICCCPFLKVSGMEVEPFDGRGQ